MSHGQMSDMSSFHNPQKTEKATAFEKANHARELELKIIQQTLKRSKEDQIDEINKSYKWEMEALR
jgi:hypothetical protein